MQEFGVGPPSEGYRHPSPQPQEQLSLSPVVTGMCSSFVPFDGPGALGSDEHHACFSPRPPNSSVLAPSEVWAQVSCRRRCVPSQPRGCAVTVQAAAARGFKPQSRLGPQMEPHVTTPRLLNYLPFQLSQKWNLKPVSRESPAPH